MRLYSTLLIILSLLTFFNNTSQAQAGEEFLKHKLKDELLEKEWKKITQEQLNYSHCDFEPEAQGIVLYSSGRLSILSTGAIFTAHYRIKILDEKAKDLANIVIPYYSPDSLIKIYDFEAFTLNQQEDGSLIYDYVEKNQIFDVKIDNQKRELRFTLPKIRKGSIIEYRYSLKSYDLLNLESWSFTSNLPVLSSEFKAKNHSSNISYNIILQGSNLKKKYAGKPIAWHWELRNLHSINDNEPFVSNVDDYHEKVEFQLSKYVGASGIFEIASDWKSFTKLVLKNEKKTGYSNDKKNPTELFNTLKIAEKSEIDKLKILHKYVSSNFSFNGYFRYYTNSDLKEFEKYKIGNSAEINTYLAYLLNRAKLKADLVLISTRGHGKVNKSFPLINQFNHFLVKVQIDTETFLLDATNPLLPYYLLPINTLNGEGLVLDNKNGEWVTIPTLNSTTNIYTEYDFRDIKQPTIKANLLFHNYAAYGIRKIVNEKGLDELKKIFDKNVDLTLKEFSINGLDSLEKRIEINARYDYKDLTNNLLYFSPIIWSTIDENPFKSDARNLPIEFPIKEEVSIVSTIKLPIGYEVQDLPKNLKVLLPEKMGEYSYTIGQINENLSLRAKYTRDKGILMPEFNQALKEFYTQLIAKQQEQVVLKKKEN